MHRKSLLVATTLLFVALGGVASATFAFQAGRTSVATPPPIQPGQPSATSDQRWEYRILSTYLVRSIPASPISAPGLAELTSALERQINELAAQGFEIESLQPVFNKDDSYPIPGTNQMAPFEEILVKKPPSCPPGIPADVPSFTSVVLGDVWTFHRITS